METLLRELRHGVRSLAKSPAFAVIAVLTLALGMGASTAIYSVLDAVLFRPLPYPNPQRVVAVWERAPANDRMRLADANFEDFRAQNHTLTALAEHSYTSLVVAGGSEPTVITGAEVSQDFFKALGVQPFLGRWFVPEELREKGARATIVSYDYWRRYLGGSSELTKFHLAMNGAVYSVVGVMPQGFDFPPKASLWIARETDPQQPSRTAHDFECLGRLRDDVTVAQARADLDAIAKRIRADYGEKADLSGATVIPLSEAVLGDVRAPLFMLLAAVILLFLVACANVAGLLLARTAARRKELTIRAALGAGRWRLLQQLLAESLVLCLAGAVLGIAMAEGAIYFLPARVPADLPRQQCIAINAPVLLFTVITTLVTALGLGFFAAWHAGGRNLSDALSSASRTYTGASQKARSMLVIGEIAATLVLLAGAGLLGRSFLKLIAVSPGFSVENLMILKFSLPQSERSATLAALTQPEITRQTHFLDKVLARLRDIPGVESAGLTGGLPVADEEGFPDGMFLLLNGQTAPTNFEEWERFAKNVGNTGYALYSVGSPGYFGTLGIRLISGRMFDAQDGPDAPDVAVISETLARQQWSHHNPIGQVIDFGNMDGNLKPLTIVGVVGDVHARGLDQPPSPIIYVDFRQRGLSDNTSPAIVLRSSLPASTIIPAAQTIFHELDPNVPVQFSTFAQALGGWLAQRRFVLLLAGVFAGAALALAAVGVYGLIAYSVARRTPEIGIRMALGAQPNEVLRLILAEGARLAVIGLVIGIAASLFAAKLLSGLLFAVKATDPLTLLTVAVLLTAVALLASYIPAHRAMHVNPVAALRCE